MLNISIQVKSVNGGSFIERKSYIEWNTFRKEDVLTTQVDTLTFTVKNYAGRTWTPETGDEIIVLDGTTRIYGGYIIKVDESTDAGTTIVYKVTCKDYIHIFDRTLVVAEYLNKTVEEIIRQICTDFIPAGFTTTNVNCTILVDKIQFNYDQPSKCIQRLADLFNFNWYIDYDKDVHFISKYKENAPFSITDTSENYIFDSLEIKEDLSQLKNSVVVRGGEFTSSAPRTEQYKADGSQTSFPLIYRYATAPAVTVNGVTKTVGAEGLDSFDTYDILWSYNGKYIRFDSAVTTNQVVAITGNPIFSVLSSAKNQKSIAIYGKFESKIIDKLAISEQMARNRANAELNTYAFPMLEGSFQTYVSGLRSGQLITVKSTLRNVDQSFLIQRVKLNMIGANNGFWDVTLVSVKKYGILEFLQSIILAQTNNTELDSNEIIEFLETLDENILVEELITVHTSFLDYVNISIEEQIRANPWTIQFVLGNYFPTNDADPKRNMRLDISSYLY